MPDEPLPSQTDNEVQPFDPPQDVSQDPEDYVPLPEDEDDGE